MNINRFAVFTRAGCLTVARPSPLVGLGLHRPDRPRASGSQEHFHE